MHYCVLGGTGFIGRHLVNELLMQGNTVSTLSRTPLDARYASAQRSRGVRSVIGDLADEAAVSDALSGADVCFHLVSTTLPRSSNEDPIYDITSNVGGTLALLQKAVLLGVPRVVFVSSGGTVYGPPQFLPVTENHPLEPNCSYGISKLAIEKYLHLFQTLYGLDYRIVRLANPYGEGQQVDRAQGAVTVFLHRAMAGESIEIWGDGSTVRDYLHVSDAVRGIVSVANDNSQERIFNIGSGEGHPLTYLIDEIKQLLRRDVNVRFLPGRPFDVPKNVLCIERARTVLGFEPKTSFADGLARTAKWLSASANRPDVIE